MLRRGLQTTTAPALVERVGDEVRKAGATMIDAPVMVRSTRPALLSALRRLGLAIALEIKKNVWTYSNREEISDPAGVFGAGRSAEHPAWRPDDPC